MRAGSGQIDSTARLGATEIGVVVRETDWGVHAQQSTVGVDDLYVVGVSGGDTLSRAVHVKSWSCRIHGDHSGQSSAAGAFAGKTGSVSSKTVANDDHLGEGGTHGLVQEISHLRHTRSNFEDPVASSSVVAGLSTRSPVHDDHVESASVQVGSADAGVDRGSAVVVPSVDNEAEEVVEGLRKKLLKAALGCHIPSWFVGPELGVGDGGCVSNGEHLACSWVTGSEQAEDDIVVHIPSRVDGGVLLVQVGQVHVTIAVGNQVPFGHEFWAELVLWELGSRFILGKLWTINDLGELRRGFVLKDLRARKSHRGNHKTAWHKFTANMLANVQEGGRRG